MMTVTLTVAAHSKSIKNVQYMLLFLLVLSQQNCLLWSLNYTQTNIGHRQRCPLVITILTIINAKKALICRENTQKTQFSYVYKRVSSNSGSCVVAATTSKVAGSAALVRTSAEKCKSKAPSHRNERISKKEFQKNKPKFVLFFIHIFSLTERERMSVCANAFVCVG